jgi:hypothetical protein
MIHLHGKVMLLAQGGHRQAAMQAGCAQQVV